VAKWVGFDHQSLYFDSIRSIDHSRGSDNVKVPYLEELERVAGRVAAALRVEWHGGALLQHRVGLDDVGVVQVRLVVLADARDGAVMCGMVGEMGAVSEWSVGVFDWDIYTTPNARTA
jgi:hypothetical protein